MSDFTLYAAVASIILLPVLYLVSKMKSRIKNYIGYGIPALLLAFSFCFFWTSFTSQTEKSQLLVGYSLIILSIPAFISIILFTTFTKKWSFRFVVNLVMGFLVILNVALRIYHF